MKALVINETRSHYGFVIDVEQNRDGSYYDSITDLVYEARELQFQWQETPLVDWQAFRREAAKDILCAIVSHLGGNANIERAVELADALIEQLKQK